MKLGVSNQFHFLGWKSPDDLIDLYAQSTLYVMPSLTEAFGIVFLEAMAAGLPVIGTSVGGIPEIIQDGVNGRLVPPRNPTALADTILGLIRQPEEQERLRRGGLERIQQFTSDNGMKCTYSVYESVLSRFKG
jgi:glycosyltransferase involved in cell wall biosynthesis